MYCERIKVFLLLFLTSILVYYYCGTNIYSIVNDHDVNISSLETMTPSLSAREANDSFMKLNRKRYYTRENSEKGYEIHAGTYNRTNIWSFDKDTKQYKNRNVILEVNDKTQSSQSFSKFLTQRIAYNTNANTRENLPKNSQKKVKILRHALFINNLSNQNEDNGYSKSMNKKKKYWVSFQDEDESNIMELIIFNINHGPNVYRSYNNYSH
ncbi:uncharacterized protein LOC132908824 [Bombus pascuorum]|uniref:uncharacterized protein LOC132908824 n=1 Tax=Bombus pascuorum TaxID=65598 RepID=UPI0021370373|nr:uncharacterized protein LOC132908824 [Bombus pascuorum]